LLWTLAGLRAPDTGEVTLDEVDELDEVGGSPARLDAAGRDDYAAAGVVIVPQGNALATVLTASENVVVPLLSAGIPAEHAHALAATTLDEVGLAGSGTQLVEELSGGQQQRVAVARGLAQRGRVLLADEPTSELDAVNRARVVALLRAEADRGAAVIMATHDPQAAEACDGELHLDDGLPTWVRRLGGPAGVAPAEPVAEQPDRQRPEQRPRPPDLRRPEQRVEPTDGQPPAGRHRSQ
jgi:putative ABC transport system ATP-binding protein